jgi:hypothetical protein
MHYPRIFMQEVRKATKISVVISEIRRQILIKSSGTKIKI